MDIKRLIIKIKAALLHPFSFPAMYRKQTINRGRPKRVKAILIGKTSGSGLTGKEYIFFPTK
jgi:hypothetical protein